MKTIKQSAWITVVIRKDSELAEQIFEQFKEECSKHLDDSIIKGISKKDEIFGDDENEII